MRLCQDSCEGNEATNIVYDKHKGDWFLVCDDCLEEDDLICKWSPQQIASMEYD